MDPFVVAVFVLAGIAISAATFGATPTAHSELMNWALPRKWNSLVRQLGLAPGEISSEVLVARGIYSGAQIRLERHLALPAYYCVVVENLTNTIRIEDETWTSGKDLSVGDPVFDRRVHVRSSIGIRAVGFLDRETRSRIRSATFRLAGGEAILTRTEVFPSNMANLRQAIKEAIVTAEPFRMEETSPAFVHALEKIAKQDPCPGVQISALRALHQSPGRCSDDVMAAALRSEDPLVAAEAVILFGTPHELVAVCGDRRVWPRLAEGPVGLQIRVIAALEAAATGTQALVFFLKGPYPTVAIQAAKALERIGTTDEIEELRSISKALMANADLNQAAHNAAAAIESRAVANRGQLSLIEGAAGELSLSETTGTLALSGQDHSKTKGHKS